MKNFTNILKAAAIAIALGGIFVSCEDDSGVNVAKAVLGDKSSLSFEARSPKSQTVSVISDGEWHTTAPDWITVDPATGVGETIVTVSAAENADAAGLFEPRRDTLIFSGNTLASRLIIIVSQEGDAYRNAQHQTIEQISALADSKSFILDEATVAAVTKAGLVLTDASGVIYAQTKESAEVGSKVSVKGQKGTANGLPVIANVDELNVASTGTYTYPEAAVLNDKIAGYTPETYEYVSVSGIVSGGNLTLTVDEAEYAVKQVDVPDDLSISKLNGNKVELTGYICGVLGANMFGILTTAVKDNGPSVVPRPDKLLRAKWRFTSTTMTAYQDLFGGTAGKLDSSEGDGGLYVPSNVEGNGQITYWQVDKSGIDTNNKVSRIVGATGHPYVTGAWPGDYWLFSATDNYEYPAGTNIHIKFITRISATGHKYWMLEYFDGNDWKPADEYPVETETETGTSAQYNFINQTTNVEVECNWTLAAACREPKFRMRCVANWQSNGKGALSAPNGGTIRIADNGDDGEDAGPVFEVTDAPVNGGGSGMQAGVILHEDDFEWLEQWSAAANAPDEVKDNAANTSSDFNVFSKFKDAATELFSTRGYNFIYGSNSNPTWTMGMPDDANTTLYIRRNYFKFGKTSYNSGLVLPALSKITGTVDAELSFDWCFSMTGANKPDITTLTVEVVSGGGTVADSGTAVSSPIESAQKIEDDKTSTEWQHVTLRINGLDATSCIAIRPTNPDPAVSSTRKQNRWFLDNVKVVTVK